MGTNPLERQVEFRIDRAASKEQKENMANPDLKTKLEILADAAKYDASCASSGAPKRDSKNGTGVGSTTGEVAPDDTAASLLGAVLRSQRTAAGQSAACNGARAP